MKDQDKKQLFIVMQEFGPVSISNKYETARIISIKINVEIWVLILL